MAATALYVPHRQWSTASVNIDGPLCYMTDMCGRITQKSPPNQLGLKIVNLIEEPVDAPPRYNGAPGQEHWVIRQHPQSGERTLSRLTWGLIPNWIKEASPKL